jgi:hypothetical protein
LAHSTLHKLQQKNLQHSKRKQLQHALQQNKLQILLRRKRKPSGSELRQRQKPLQMP